MTRASQSWFARAIAFVTEAKPLVLMAVLALLLAGAVVSPFTTPWLDGLGLPRTPVAATAIPDLGDNQQIVTASWPGATPRDLEDQVTNPLSSVLLGVSGVRSVRGMSTFGLSTIYVLFGDDVDTDRARSRIAETLLSLEADALPDEVRPTLGPDANALGQVYWYTLEARTADGEVAAAFDLHELRTLQDFTVGPALAAVEDVAEVASIGGHVVQWWIEADPEVLRAHGLSLGDLARAAQDANMDVGARAIEMQQAEYLVRGVGRLESLADLENAPVDDALTIGDVAHVGLGPAERRGVLDDAGAEVVGGIVTIRQGANPRQVIGRVNDAIARLAPSLPTRVVDGTEVRVTVAPFYDRSELVEQTLSTLSGALWNQLLVTLLVVLLMMRGIRAGLLVALIPPLGVVAAFVAMRVTGVQANVMALAGIAIAIGSMVDIGIVFTEAVQRRLDDHASELGADTRSELTKEALVEVAPSVITSVGTTIIGFLPVLALTGDDGKIFRPLAWTKTYALIGALGVALLVTPALSAALLRRTEESRRSRGVLAGVALLLGVILVSEFRPLPNPFWSALLVASLFGIAIGGLHLFARFYARILRWVLAHRALFAIAPVCALVFGGLVWFGAPKASLLREAFPGLKSAQMPDFDEGALLYMPVTMPHASIGAARTMLSEMDTAIAAIPEVDRVVGKLGRADTALDPAPIAMFEVLITLHPEFREVDGEPVRVWRDSIRTTADVWAEISRVAQRPGLTPAPPLQPIATRQLMLRTGMRGRIGVALRAPDAGTLDAAGRRVEAILRELDGLDSPSVQAERVVGKPYLEVVVDREATRTAGARVADVQRTLAQAVGGMGAGYVIDGRTRTEIRVRAVRDARQSPEAIEALVVTSDEDGSFVRLGDVADVRYVRGPQALRSEDTFLTSYVTFDTDESLTDVEAAARVSEALESATFATGVTWSLRGAFEREAAASAQLRVLIPLALLLILMLLYLQFRDLVASLFVFAGVAVAVSGGFIALAVFGASPWPEALDVALGTGRIDLTVAVWVGFIALAGIAVDDGVLLTTFVRKELEGARTLKEIRAAVLAAGERRLRPCLMTTATTLLALIPVLFATGRGADVMRPMAIPLFGGMVLELLTLFVVPVLTAWRAERALTLTHAPAIENAEKERD